MVDNIELSVHNNIGLTLWRRLYVTSAMIGCKEARDEV